MKNIRMKTLALILALLTMTACMTTGHAVTDASQCIRSVTLSCSAYAGGIIEAGISVSCNNMATTLGFSTLAIDEYRDGEWVQVAVLSNDFVSDAYSHHASIQYKGTPGKQYRSRATVRALYQGVYEYRYPEMGPATAK